MKWALVVLVAAVLLADGYVRFAPSDPSVWHVDPLTAPPSGPNSVTMKPGGAEPAPVYDLTPAELMSKLDTVIRQTPRTHLLAGSVSTGFATYVVRSLVWGFPDYVSIKVLPAPGGSTFAVWSRARFGRSDLGVNRARLNGWIAELSRYEAKPAAPTGAAG